MPTGLRSLSHGFPAGAARNGIPYIVRGSPDPAEVLSSRIDASDVSILRKELAARFCDRNNAPPGTYLTHIRNGRESKFDYAAKLVAS